MREKCETFFDSLIRFLFYFLLYLIAVHTLCTLYKAHTNSLRILASCRSSVAKARDIARCKVTFDNALPISSHRIHIVYHIDVISAQKC
jgi:hypothetical protein